MFCHYRRPACHLRRLPGLIQRLQLSGLGADIPPVDTGLARERGFTLIELVTALSLLSVAILGMASVFTAAARTTGVDLHRAVAVGLATQATEDLKTMAYPNLGMPDGTTSINAPACAGLGTVVTADASAVVVTDTDTPPGGVTYTLNRCITWADATQAAETQAYKRTTVVVNWVDAGIGHTVRQDSVIYPGGQGPYPRRVRR